MRAWCWLPCRVTCHRDRRMRSPARTPADENSVPRCLPSGENSQMPPGPTEDLGSPSRRTSSRRDCRCPFPVLMSANNSAVGNAAVALDVVAHDRALRRVVDVENLPIRRQRDSVGTFEILDDQLQLAVLEQEYALVWQLLLEIPVGETIAAAGIREVQRAVRSEDDDRSDCSAAFLHSSRPGSSRAPSLLQAAQPHDPLLPHRRCALWADRGRGRWRQIVGTQGRPGRRESGLASRGTATSSRPAVQR